jgi:8-oxo-dGTP pyrophosphatase MutT (NUDIX family)
MNIYCNNCGKKGHFSKKCNNPITSIGIVCHNLKKNKYLMIRRKHTVSYISFIRGIYNLYDISYITKLFNYMTVDEKKKILEYEFDFLWKDLWMFNIKHMGKYFKNIKNKFYKIKDGITIDNRIYILKDIIENSSNNWKEQEWGFPKGKKIKNETNLSCAKREFEEETCISEDKYIILNIKPVKEIFTGLNGLQYKYIYYIAQMKEDVDVSLETRFQKMEISDIKWLSVINCYDKIRDYSIEKKNILKKIENKINSDF